jgi:hypothetical protein
MYHPPASGAPEYLELHNASPVPVTLGDGPKAWRISGGIQFTFPPYCTIPPGGYLLVVGFDPRNDEALGAFRSAYQYEGSAGLIVGPWTGALANEGEYLRLERPLLLAGGSVP